LVKRTPISSPSNHSEEEDPSLTSLSPSAQSSEDNLVFNDFLAYRVVKTLIETFNYHLAHTLNNDMQYYQEMESIFEFSKENFD
jgi:hypothetical protein